ncbi:L-lactate permease (plasmid) [Deefgea piscis]|uniref:L-lactate permease n=1 Tax=Deefgea piscis TaxID=2739061 RepID=A0A6M8SVX6_9NEIS|nr:L-lactate permease [Deefgea piscis]QKJ68284.1 L-lactate permease [Deefgea piscis]
MTSILQLSPIVLVITMIMGFRKPPMYAALGGALLAFLLWLFDVAQPFLFSTLSSVFVDSLVLFMSTAFVIAPGLVFVIYLERAGANDALSKWVKQLGWQGAAQVVFLVLGLAPLLEAMTGFGVSLIATVPLLIALMGRKVALRVALTGMCIMPWGTLGLATVIGAELAGLPSQTLGAWTAWTSAPVFTAGVLLALWLAGHRKVTAYALGVVFSVAFVSILHLISRDVGPEVAGVGAAATVTLVGIIWARLHLKSNIRFPVEAWPYAALLIAIISLKATNLSLGLDTLWVIHGEQVSWKPLASPGIALLLVNFILMVKLGGEELAKPFLSRAKRPLITIFFFLFMSQLLVKAGFLDGVRLALSSLDTAALAPLIAAFGGLAGYITGSNVGGNAIVMPSIAHMNLPENVLSVLAAVQNSAAGHAALGSMPIVALLLGLAKGSAEEEQELIRFAFLLALFNVILVGSAGYLLISLTGG